MSGAPGRAGLWVSNATTARLRERGGGGVRRSFNAGKGTVDPCCHSRASGSAARLVRKGLARGNPRPARQASPVCGPAVNQAPALKLIEVVAAVIESEGRILCVQRGPSARAYISGKWEFPGGKVEAGEGQEVALVREIEEELRLAVRPRDRLVTVEHVYPDFGLRMHAYLCSLVEPDRKVVLTEHLDFRWEDPSSPAFVALDWAAADLPIVELLRRRAERP